MDETINTQLSGRCSKCNGELSKFFDAKNGGCSCSGKELVNKMFSKPAYIIKWYDIKEKQPEEGDLLILALKYKDHDIEDYAIASWDEGRFWCESGCLECSEGGECYVYASQSTRKKHEDWKLYKWTYLPLVEDE